MKYRKYLSMEERKIKAIKYAVECTENGKQMDAGILAAVAGVSRETAGKVIAFFAKTFHGEADRKEKEPTMEEGILYADGVPKEANVLLRLSYRDWCKLKGSEVFQGIFQGRTERELRKK